MYYIGYADLEKIGSRKNKISLAVFGTMKSLNKLDRSILKDYESGMSEKEILEKYPESKGAGNKPILESLTMGDIYYGVDFISDNEPNIYLNFEFNENFPAYVSDIYTSKQEALDAFRKGFLKYYKSNNIEKALIKALFVDEITNMNSI